MYSISEATVALKISNDSIHRMMQEIGIIPRWNGKVKQISINDFQRIQNCINETKKSSQDNQRFWMLTREHGELVTSTRAKEKLRIGSEKLKSIIKELRISTIRKGHAKLLRVSDYEKIRDHLESKGRIVEVVEEKKEKEESPKEEVTLWDFNKTIEVQDSRQDESNVSLRDLKNDLTVQLKRIEEYQEEIARKDKKILFLEEKNEELSRAMNGYSEYYPKLKELEAKAQEYSRLKEAINFLINQAMH